MALKQNTSTKLNKHDVYNLKDHYERTYFLFMSLVKARNIATVIVGCSSIVPNDSMLFVGDKESLPFTIGVDVTLWSSLVDAMDTAANLGRLAPWLYIYMENNEFKSENW